MNTFVVKCLNMSSYLYEAGYHTPSVFARFVVDLGGEFDDLSWSVSSQVTASLQHECARLHKEVGELLSCHSTAGLLGSKNIFRAVDSNMF